MAEGRLWEQQVQRRKFRNANEVRDPETVVDTRPDLGGPDEVSTQASTDPAAAPIDVPKPPAMRDAAIPPSAELVELEKAAELLMRYLPDETQVLIREAHEQLKLPFWQMLLGYAMRARERDEVFWPVILSMWENALPADAPRPCATCGSIFRSKFGDGLYCCNPCFFGKLSVKGHAEECPTRKVETA